MTVLERLCQLNKIITDGHNTLAMLRRVNAPFIAHQEVSSKVIEAESERRWLENKIKKDLTSGSIFPRMSPMKNQLAIIKSVRKVWDFRPTSRVVPSKKQYSRKKSKLEND